MSEREDGAERRTVPRVCPLCEASCGLLLELEGRRVVGVRANPDDVFSRGHSCAKGQGLADFEADPDRVRTPLVRRDGVLVPATWDEAFAEIAARLPAFLARDPQSVAIYQGNPAANHLDHSLYLQSLVAAIGTRNVFSPASIDTLPKNLVTALLYGTGLGMAVPDVDRTDYFLLVGSNPLVSNGSTLSAPGIQRRLAALQERGGRFVVVDPVRTASAEMADRHVAPRPGTDALLLMGVLSAIATEHGAAPGRAGRLVDGLDEVLAVAREFTPEAVAGACGVEPAVIRDIARDLASSDRAVVSSRMGSCTQEFGTITNWLVEVLNIVTGNLDEPGGAMFPLPPAGGPTTWAGKVPVLPFDRWRSRVRGLPEGMGELPAPCLAEEILVPGPGQVRALITIAGNPARSVPNSGHVERALEDLDFMLSIDTYLNETTRHADVFLPGSRLITRGHHSIAMAHFAVRNVARYSPAVDPPRDDEVPEWHLLLRIAAIAAGTPDRPVEELDKEISAVAARRAGALAGRTTEEVLAASGGRVGPERLLDLRLRSGPYGDRFGTAPDGLTLDLLEQRPNGIDYGPLRPRLPEVLRTPGNRIDLAPRLVLDDVARLRTALDRPREHLQLVNRRQRRGMNSWLHNALPQRDSGQSALFMNPDDAAARELVDGDRVAISTEIATVHAEVLTTDAMRRGVVSLPHGWGHHGAGLRMGHATAAPGTNLNALVDDVQLEPVSHAPYFNGFEVEVALA